MQTIATSSYDTSGELILQRHQAGVRLIRPESVSGKPSGHRLTDLLNLPLYFFLGNTNHEVVTINEQTALACGWESVNDAIGKTLQTVAGRKTAELLSAHNREVMTTRMMHINEEHYSRNDGIEFITTGFKFPWYNEANEVIGVFGCSIKSNDNGSPTFAQSMTTLLQTGLLDNAASFQQPSVCTTYNLSMRQSKCLHFLSKGMTSKQIGRELGLSHRTVEHYIDIIKVKMNCEKRSELIIKYLEEK